MTLSHFYHIYADGQWKQPVSEHIKALKEYGLLDALQTFAIGMVGNSDNCAKVVEYLAQENVCYHLCDQQPSGWEQVTQIKMWEFSKDNDGLMLYAHSKGSSNPADVNVRWRRSMTWHNVCQWKFAVEKLQDHKSYGCHWLQPLLEGMKEHRQGNWMYCGTFYWIHCDLLRTFMKPPLNHRHEAEGYIGYKYAESPWPVWDCTPYFPNTDTFMDAWLDNPNYNPAQRGISIAPKKTVNQL